MLDKNNKIALQRMPDIASFLNNNKIMLLKTYRVISKCNSPQKGSSAPTARQPTDITASLLFYLALQARKHCSYLHLLLQNNIMYLMERKEVKQVC